MKFICNSATLSKLLSTVSPAVSQKGEQLILQSVKFDVDQRNKSVIISAFNGDMALKIKKSFPVEGNISYCVPFSELSAVAQDIKDPELTITDFDPTPKNTKRAGMHFWLKSEFGLFPIATKDPNQFPADPVLFNPEGRPFGISSFHFYKGLSQVRSAASTDGSKPILTGIAVEIDSDHIEFAATDGIVCAVYRMTGKTETDEYIDMVLPTLSIPAILNVIDPGNPKGITKGFISTQSMMFQDESISFSTRLMGGRYPAYQSLFPQAYEDTIQIDPEQFLASLRPLLRQAATGSDRILTVIDDKGFEFTVGNLGSTKSGKVKLPCSNSLKEPFRFVTSGSGLMKALSSLKGKDIQLKINRGTTRPLPVVFESISGNVSFKVLLSVLDPGAVR
jgi:DNA polymerase III subunit beta